MNSWRHSYFAVLLVGLITSCISKENRNQENRSQTVQPISSAVAVPASPVELPAPTRPKLAGPPFPIEAGVGLGPIRFGSTVATVERHMQTKCEQLTDRVCRYIAAGIELELKDGAVAGIVIQRPNRPVLPVGAEQPGSQGRTWGMFAGGIPPKVYMMMVPEAVIEQIGKPKKTEAVAEDNPNWTVRRDYYDGMVLEYDKNRANNRLMLGQVRILKR